MLYNDTIRPSPCLYCFAINFPSSRSWKPLKKLFLSPLFDTSLLYSLLFGGGGSYSDDCGSTLERNFKNFFAFFLLLFMSATTTFIENVRVIWTWIFFLRRGRIRRKKEGVVFVYFDVYFSLLITITWFIGIYSIWSYSNIYWENILKIFPYLIIHHHHD